MQHHYTMLLLFIAISVAWQTQNYKMWCVWPKPTNPPPLILKNRSHLYNLSIHWFLQFIINYIKQFWKITPISKYEKLILKFEKIHRHATVMVVFFKTHEIEESQQHYDNIDHYCGLETATLLSYRCMIIIINN